MPRKRTRRNSIPPSKQPRAHRVIDSFTEQDLEDWSSRAELYQSYCDKVYFELEAQRAQHYDALCSALQSTPSIEVQLDGWMRVTDYRWSLAPLSSVGSIKQIGGRFNIGKELNRARGQAFPSLYIGQSFATCLCEFFGTSLSNGMNPLSLHELALRREISFTTLRLEGNIDHVLDLRTPTHLKPFTDIIKRFRLSSDTQRFARKNRIRPSKLAQTPNALLKIILSASAQWRMEPNMFGVPAPSQIFGIFARDAGFEAILYPSQQGDANCLAVYPQNFVSSNSSIIVVGATPTNATCIVLDKDHLCMDELVL
jgi:hypothetical protein